MDDEARRAVHSKAARLDVTPKTTEQNRIVRTSEFEVEVTNNKKNCARRIVLELEAMTLTTDRFEASRGLFATAELLVAPVRESQLEYWHNVSYEKKLKWWVYQMVKDSLRMCLRVSTQYTNVMDEQTAWLGYSRAAKKCL